MTESKWIEVIGYLWMRSGEMDRKKSPVVLLLLWREVDSAKAGPELALQ